MESYFKDPNLNGKTKILADYQVPKVKRTVYTVVKDGVGFYYIERNGKILVNAGDFWTLWGAKRKLNKLVQGKKEVNTLPKPERREVYRVEVDQ